MKNITVLISSFLGRGQRWRLVALAALFFVAGCTVELYPPAQEVSDLPDGGKVDVLPDTIPRAFAFGPRIYWSQIIGSDSAYSIAVTDSNNKGRWLDSLQWVPSGPFVTVNGDTLSTRAYARDNSGVTGDNQVLTYNGSGSLTIEDGNTVDMSDLLDNTDDQTIDTFSLSGNTLSLSLEGDGEATKTVDLSSLTTNETITLSGDVTGSGTTAITTTIDTGAVGPDELASTAVTPGSYTHASITVDADGRVTAASSGTDNTGMTTFDVIGDAGTAETITDADELYLRGQFGINTSNSATDIINFEVDTSEIATQYDLTQVTSLVDSTRLTQDSILVYYQDGAEVGRDTIAGVGGGGADNLGDHIMTQNLVTNGNWISGDGGNEGIYVDNTGRVGIGTNNPAYFFYVTGPTNSESRIQNMLFQVVSNDQYLQTTNGNFYYRNVQANKDLIMSVNNATNGFGTAMRLYGGSEAINFQTAGTERLRIVSNGNVGIGTTNPSYILDINSTDAVRLPVGTTAQRPAGANGVLRYNTDLTAFEGYYNAQWNTLATESDYDDGSASDTTDGSGDITVSHTLGSASITVTATATGTTFYHVQVHSKTSTTFKIRFYNSPGSAATSTAVTADWIAKLQ